MLRINDYLPREVPHYERTVARCVPPVYLADGLADFCAEVDSLEAPSFLQLLGRTFFVDAFALLRRSQTYIFIPSVGISPSDSPGDFWIHGDRKSILAYWGNGECNHQPTRTYEEVLAQLGSVENEQFTVSLGVVFPEKMFLIHDIRTDTLPRLREIQRWAERKEVRLGEPVEQG